MPIEKPPGAGSIQYFTVRHGVPIAVAYEWLDDGSEFFSEQESGEVR
jgi:hypothetical protein